MFIFRFFRRLIYLAIFYGVVVYGSQYITIQGKTARAWADEFFASTEWKEGSKDLRTWIGALLKLAGDKVQEGITPQDEAALRNVITTDLQKQFLPKVGDAPAPVDARIQSVLEQAGLAAPTAPAPNGTNKTPQAKTPVAPKTPTVDPR